MPPEIAEIVTTFSVFVLMPSVVVGGIIAMRALKLKARQLDLESQRLEIERTKLQFLTTENQKQLLDELSKKS